jgi:ABC-type molybdate transport system substrate-binding protein
MDRPEAGAPVRLYAAGSLKAAFGEIAAAVTGSGGPDLNLTFGAAGLLKDRIAGGEPCDVFASANMEHPRALAGSSDGVRVFARNRLCALVRADLGVTTETLLARMLDPAFKLGTSTPGADPSGDYAHELFAKAEGVRAGARTALAAKALALTGSPASPKVSSRRSVYSRIMAERAADIFLTYVTNAVATARDVPGIAVVELPDDLAVGADYGLVALSGRAEAEQIAAAILSAAGQEILARHGFAPAIA